MNHEVKGSDLVRLMLSQGAKEIWCAVDDISDEQAISDHNGNDFTAYIVSYYDGRFYCSAGTAWLYAVPIRISEVVHCEMAG